MNRLFIFILLAIEATFAQESATERKLLKEARVTKGDIFNPEEFQIELKDLVIRTDIYGHLVSGKEKKSVDLGKGFFTSTIHFLDGDSTAILFFEIADGEGSSNDVYCIDKKTLKTIWSSVLLSFNLTVGEAVNDTLYLSAGENAYAMSISGGSILWQTPGLYFNYGFNSFDSIAIDEETIRLKGKSNSGERGEIFRTATLEKSSGKILGVK